MSTIFIDMNKKVIGAQLTDEEFGIISPVMSTPEGSAGITDIFDTIIKQFRTEQRHTEDKIIAAYVAQATEVQRADLLQFIQGK